MLATYTNARLTPMPFDQAAEAMKAALRNDSGAEPSRTCLALALAKCALETGRFMSIWNHNYGNVKAGATYAGMYCCFELNEVLDGRVVWFGPRGRLDRKGGSVVAEPYDDPPGHPQTRMRAYENRFTGADAYVEFMARGAGGRFAQAFNFMKVGNAPAMVTEMKAKRYMTADVGPYLNAVVSLQREFDGKLQGQRPPEVDVTDEQVNAFRIYRNEEAIEAFLVAEMDREISAGPQAGRNLLDYEAETDANELKPEEA
ncbi:MAG TPA: hypothetical protein VJN18_32695 [Polyangiaceae bacterium]|nr:hypothetical protein [Polyangiaceae bacterium]